MSRIQVLWLFALTAVFSMLSNLHAQDQDSKTKDDEKVYSGPQVSEQIPKFVMKGALGKNEVKEIDLVKTADGKPLVIVFVHERSRPAFGDFILLRWELETSTDLLRWKIHCVNVTDGCHDDIVPTYLLV